MCCDEDTAECLACKAGWSIDEFCASQQNLQVRGCDRQCCVDWKATCLACKAGLSIADYCTRPGHDKVPGCNKHFCCSEMTAECLACRDHVSTEEYCSNPENARVSGCRDPSRHAEDPPAAAPVAPTAPAASAAPAEDESAARCCTEDSAKCLACEAGVSVGDFCLDQKHSRVLGCNGFCGLIEDDYVYPGGNIFDIRNVASAQDCCDRCRHSASCTSWSWGKKPGTTYHNWCYLKNQMEFIRRKDTSFVSGVPGRNTMTFQIKSRHGACLDWGDHLHLADCGNASKESQQWYIDRRAGVIGTRHGLCVDSVEYLSPGGGIHLQPCIASLPSQMWAFDGISGTIRHNRGFCLDAPGYDTPGSRVRMWPCNSNSNKQLWSFWNTDVLGQSATRQAMQLEAQTITTTTTTTATTVTVVRVEAPSLYCWSLMLPWGYEHKLVELQYKHRKSIFLCDEADVYSSSAIKMEREDGSSVEAKVVNHDLHCKIGGQYMTALNTPIFVHVWKKVPQRGLAAVVRARLLGAGDLVHDAVADWQAAELDVQVLSVGHWKRHAWTVKADPDAVFFPTRLRRIVEDQEDPQAGDGIFLINCRFGLHGPLEVFSRRALQRYDEGWETCQQPPQEDVFVQTCLKKLGATEVDAFELLAEEHCQSEHWERCEDSHAAFHPFKTVEKYAECLRRAEKYDDDRGFQPVRVLHA